MLAYRPELERFRLLAFIVSETSPPRIVVVTPVLNDWLSLNELMKELAALPDVGLHVLAVDDGSAEPFRPSADLLTGAVKRIQILRLRANQGHQRAIALGLAYAMRNLAFDCALVMDCDGEDEPSDVARMIMEGRQKPHSLIVAQRRRRSEGLGFVLFYHAYRMLFLSLTGKPISFGNFSLLPRTLVDRVLFNPGVWNNFAATMLRSRAPIAFLPTTRGKRYFGASTMNFSSLIVHGMSAISVFSDIVIGRLVIGLCLLIGLFAIAVAGVFAAKYITVHFHIAGLFVPGYITNVVLILSNMLVTSLFIGLLMILSLLASRSTPAALPSILLDHLVASLDEIERDKLHALAGGS